MKHAVHTTDHRAGHRVPDSAARNVFEFAKIFLYLALASFLLLWPAFWNGYPLFFSDSGSYIYSAFTLKVLIDRPIGYSYFIRFFSQGFSLWPVVYAQAFFAAYLTWKFLGVFVKKHRYQMHFLLMLVLAFFTIAPWMASQIMPDIFTALIFLIVFVFLFGENVFWERCFLVALLMVFSVTHSANFLLMFGVLFFAFLFLRFGKNFPEHRKKYFGNMAVLAVATLFVPLFFLYSNYHQGFGSVLSPSSHVFMMSRVNEAGILDRFLQQHCSVTHYDLCTYEGHFLQGDQFIWGGQSPPNVKGWLESKPEYDAILRQVFSTPAYDWIFLTDSLYRSARLFFMFGMDNYASYNALEPVYFRIENYFPQELKSDIAARQYQGELWNVDGFALLFIAVTLVSLVGLGWLLFSGRLNREEKTFLFMLFVFLIVNACLLAALSGVYGRYQERLVWLLPMTAFIFFGSRVKLPRGR